MRRHRIADIDDAGTITVAAGQGVKVDDAKADSSVKDTAKSVTEDAKQTVNEIKDQINGTQNEKKDGQA